MQRKAKKINKEFCICSTGLSLHICARSSRVTRISLVFFLFFVRWFRLHVFFHSIVVFFCQDACVCARERFFFLIFDRLWHSIDKNRSTVAKWLYESVASYYLCSLSTHMSAKILQIESLTWIIKSKNRKFLLYKTL